MPKQPSIITIAKQGNGYSVDARGAFGGGWTKHAEEDELPGTIIRAWQMYGSNPLGCSVIGDIPEIVQPIIVTMETGMNVKASILVRLTTAEADLIRLAAESTGKSLNQWCREKLVDCAGTN